MQYFFMNGVTNLEIKYKISIKIEVKVNFASHISVELHGLVLRESLGHQALYLSIDVQDYVLHSHSFLEVCCKEWMKKEPIECDEIQEVKDIQCTLSK